MQLKKEVKKYIYLFQERERLSKELEIIQCLSKDEDTGFNVNLKEWNIFLKKIKEQYKEIRLHRLWSTRVGEYIPRYLMAIEKSNKNARRKILDVFVLSDCINYNSRLLRVMGRHIHLIDKTNVNMWIYILAHFPKVEIYKFWEEYTVRRKDGRFFPDNLTKYFTLTEEELAEGEYKKKKIGLEDSFVCVASRDSAYLSTILPEFDCHYHDYRDSDINRIKSSADYLAKEGITTVRMGRYVQEKVTFNNCLDYANSYYDELLDIILMKDCKFYAGDPTGIFALPLVLNKPLALKNCVPFFTEEWGSFPQQNPNLLILIFKKYRIKTENRFLSIKEMMQIDKSIEFDGHNYEKLGIEVVENSEEEILDLVMEVNARVDGKWIETSEDIELQKKFHMIYREWGKKSRIKESALFRGKIGTMFLKKNSYLLNEIESSSLKI